MTDEIDRATAQRVLNFEMLGNEPGAATIREYLSELLWTLWTDEDGFSGKRPFGRSSWKYELYGPLVDAGLIGGTIREDGHATDVNTEAGNRLILAAIVELGEKP